MTHLTILNIGPIEKVDIDLNKVNIIMGPQSSGKSTINKIACYCKWVEKKVCLSQDFVFFMNEDNFRKELVRFHKLSGYLRKESYILYTSDTVRIEYKNEQPYMEWIDKWGYKKTKVSYMPAERNLVATIPNWLNIKLEDNNILSFMSDWNPARKLYTPKKPLPILDLNVNYYYDDSGSRDYVMLENGKALELTVTSSGLQSLIPLYVLAQYIFFKREQIDEEKSVKDLVNEQQLEEKLYEEKYHYRTIRPYPVPIPKAEYNIPSIEEQMKGKKTHYFKPGKMQTFKQHLDNYIRTQCCSLYLEEPEQNLFPSTQKILIYELVKYVLNNEDNRLFITTHSPYVLYAINNCMMGYLVKERMPENEACEMLSYSSWINPELVSIWEIENGHLRNIQDKEGILTENYFDKKMTELTDEYYQMLNYYEE